MVEGSRKSRSNSPKRSRHLCVLVHGLWGNAVHLKHLAQALRDRYGEDELVVYSTKRNAGSLTYDGIEIGAERVAKEIEDLIEELEKDSITVTKFSIVGYSLGGLVARYAIGLLSHRGLFDRIQPVNFTTFATPHLGVRTPARGYGSTLWNVIASRTLSTSGRQLFIIDKFRQTDRPLLSVLADPESIFIQALATFKHRSLYTNIVNDRSAVYYTTAISKVDPYVSIDNLQLNYVKGYDSVVLDTERPFERAPQQELPTFTERLRNNGQSYLRQTPIVLALAVVIPIATVVFLANSVYQTFRSSRRIQLHETENEGPGATYRIPVLVRNVRAGLEDAFENAASSRQPEYLPEGSEEMADVPDSPISRRSTIDSLSLEKTNTRSSDFPTLALAPEQFAMIKALDDVGFQKYPVHIHNSRHSHAAIIVRSARAAFDEGKIVVKHWLENAFEI